MLGPYMTTVNKQSTTHVSENTYFNATIAQCSWQLTMTRIHRQNKSTLNNEILLLLLTVTYLLWDFERVWGVIT